MFSLIRLLTSSRILSAVINSSYTFYWDIDKDWDLCLFSDIVGQFRPTSTLRDENPHPFGLRANRFFHANAIYYSAIVIDLVLRFTWLSRLTTRLNWVNDLESGVFALMFLEVIRRWLWIFLRVETEWGESFIPTEYFFYLSRITNPTFSPQYPWPGS